MTKKERNNARGQECTLRIAALAGYGGCASTETTVLAHAPCRDSGTGIKGPDRFAAFSCASCHDLIDKRRYPNVPGELTQAGRLGWDYAIQEAWLRGIYETQKIQGVFDE